MKEGLPPEPEYAPSKTILENLVMPEEPAKKEAPGLPTPPPKEEESPLEELVMPEQETAKPVEPPMPAPVYARQMPSAISASPKHRFLLGSPKLWFRLLESSSALACTRENAVLVKKQEGQKLGQKPATPWMVNTEEGVIGIPKKVGPAQTAAGGPVIPKNMGLEARIGGIQESQRGSFSNQYDETIGRVRPFSKWELRERMEKGGASAMPASPADATKVMTIAGRLPAIYNAAENTREAAKAAILAHGKLNFDPNKLIDPQSGTTLIQMASLIARLTHSNDV
jgi:hypothetical protein